MPRITPTDWQTQVKIFEKFGCQFVREKGDCEISYGVQKSLLLHGASAETDALQKYHNLFHSVVQVASLLIFE
ncbi:hypothetical protein H8E77_32765 [bacterium]|nr:hypothetical protein [bacterium]